MNTGNISLVMFRNISFKSFEIRIISNPRKSLRTAKREFYVSKSSLQRILHKLLHFQAYNTKILKDSKINDKRQRKYFAAAVLNIVSENQNYLKGVIYQSKQLYAFLKR